MSVDVLVLARAFSKPVDYVKAAMKFHGIAELPRFRFAGDGLDQFYSDMTAFFSAEPSCTKQEFTAECDINNIMKRFALSGYDPTVIPMTHRIPLSGDFTNMPDSYHAALNYVIQAEDAFLELPAELRARFDNDPQLYLNFVSDPANIDELVSMGLVVKPVLSPAEGGSPKDPEPSGGGNTGDVTP